MTEQYFIDYGYDQPTDDLGVEARPQVIIAFELSDWELAQAGIARLIEAAKTAALASDTTVTGVRVEHSVPGAAPQPSQFEKALSETPEADLFTEEIQQKLDTPLGEVLFKEGAVRTGATTRFTHY